MTNRRSTSSSSDSRSPSPYNKRRRGRSADKRARSPHRGNQKLTSSRRSRSPRRRPRSRSPRRQSPPPPSSSSSHPQRRRSSPGPPQRSYSSSTAAYGGNRPSTTMGGGYGSLRRTSRSPHNRRHMSPIRTAAVGRTSSRAGRGDRGKQRSPSPPPVRGRHRSPSPKRRRSPERIDSRSHHKTIPPPAIPNRLERERRSPVAQSRAPVQAYSSTSGARRDSRSRSPHNKTSTHQNRSHYKNSGMRSGTPPSTSSAYSRQLYRQQPSATVTSHSSIDNRHHNPTATDRGYSGETAPQHLQTQPSSSSAAAQQHEITFGSKDMDYRDKRMGDPANRSGNTSKENSSQQHPEHTKSVRKASKMSSGDKEQVAATSSGKKKKEVEIGYTGVSTHFRFSELDDTKNPKLKEIITIGIERNILGDEPAVISPVYKSEYVVLVRRREEGERPLTSREEFITREPEYVERRVIKVVRTTDDDNESEGDNQSRDSRRDRGGHSGQRSSSNKKRFDLGDGRENFEVRRDKMSLSQRWGDGASGRESDAKIEQRVSVRQESLRDHYIGRQVDSRLGSNDRHGDRDERRVEPRSKYDRYSRSISRDRDERIISNDEDLRGGSKYEQRHRFEKSTGDLREKLARRRGNKELMRGMGESDATTDARQKLARKRSLEGRRTEGDEHTGGRRVESRSPGTDLPDFSKRPDKGRFPVEENPESIPRGSMYYQHDNRESFDYWERRGSGVRGGFRGGFRGSSRGFSRAVSPGSTGGRVAFGRGLRVGASFGARGRGGGYYSKSYNEPTWQHDKYEEEEQPSSTTK